MTKLETMILWLHNLSFVIRNKKTKDGDPQVDVLIDTLSTRKLVCLFNDISVDLGITAIPTNAIPAPYKNRLLQTSEMISDKTVNWFSGEYWHFKVDDSDIGINTPMEALEKTIKRLENAPISVTLLFNGKETDIHSQINDESAFVKVMWVINITMLLLLKLDGPLYLGEALVSTVEISKHLSFVLMQNKRLKKLCGMEDWNRQIYRQNCSKMCQLSADIIPLVAKLNRVGKILFVDDGLPLFFAIRNDKFSVHATPEIHEMFFSEDHIHGIYDKCMKLTAKLQMELITIPVIAGNSSDKIPEDLIWYSKVELLSDDDKREIEEIFSLLGLVTQCTTLRRN